MESEDLLYVSLQGKLVACETILDAKSIRLAQDYLCNGTAAALTPNELRHLASLLKKYGQFDAAHEFDVVASRMSAAELVGRCSISSKC